MKDLRAQCEAIYKKKVEGSITDLMRAVSLDVHTGIALATPIRSGRARANWHLTVNRIDRTVSNETIQPDFAAVAADVTRDLKVTDTIYDTNNLPYIRRLNNGYSKQAPASFVEKAVLIAKNRAKRNIKTTVSA